MQQDSEQAWQEISTALRDAVDERTYGLWLAPLRCDEITAESVLLNGPHEVVVWARERLGRVIQTCAASVLGPHVTVEISTERGVARAAPAGGVARAPSPQRPRGAAARDCLHPKYTFDQFVIGPSNRLAHAAALAVAEMPGQAYNPLFIYGAPGLGKTHLLHSIGNYVRAFGGGLEVRYSTVEAFTSEFVSALNTKTIPAFKDRFRGVDVLLLDDVQFLQHKARTEEEFFHTFNALHDTGSQLVFTADRTPGDLGELEDRLRERFSSGLVTDIGRPEFTTRLAILRKRAAHDALPLVESDALEAIAAAVEGNVRALEGALIRVVAYASLTSRPLSAELANEVIARLGLRATACAVPTVERIQLATCSFFSLSPAELLSRKRDPRLAWPRQLAIYLARELTNDSLPAIGRQFGGRDHSTILSAHRRAGEQIQHDAKAYTQAEQLTAELRRAGE